MSADRFQLAVIVGSVREGRFGPVVADWFVGQAKQRDDATVDVIDLADTPVPGATFTDRIATADAYVLVTPEYNHSYPGPLKHAIDSLGRPWHAKPVGFVSYGGLSGGLRAVEPLRLVFAELHAVTIRETVSFHRAGEQFDEHGTPRDPDAVNTAAAVLLDQLAWWAQTLKTARADRPYVA
ncbi:MAG: NADPH-dependent FMN reductase [Pseudonocardiaceae bacterium]|nr:NADPH-dependent FMN reductase [Pseudonocardiaceae bacterium]